MHVATLFKRLLGLDAVCVVKIEVVERDDEQVVEVHLARRRNRRMSCSHINPCMVAEKIPI